ncbi:MAG: hypothetical protein RL088_1235 [Verrucomicrobiota bacterium]|jgi:hypothetical protein
MPVRQGGGAIEAFVFQPLHTEHIEPIFRPTTEHAMDPSTVAALAFFLVVGIPFVAFLWYGCDVRSLKNERPEKAPWYREPEEERQLRELEKARRLTELEESLKRRNFSAPAIVSRISAIRDEPASRAYKSLAPAGGTQHAAEVRTVIAAKSYFRRRRKAKPAEPNA